MPIRNGKVICHLVVLLHVVPKKNKVEIVWKPFASASMMGVVEDKPTVFPYHSPKMGVYIPDVWPLIIKLTHSE